MLTGTLREMPREGTLLPETYNFTRGTTREQVVARMAQRAARIVAGGLGRRTPDLPVKTAEELVVLASIVEKETGKPEERTRVAAVFVNRLKSNMGCNRTRPSSTVWSAARERSAAASCEAR